MTEIAAKKTKERIWLHILLFLLTFVTSAAAGAYWLGKDSTEVTNWHYGLTYAFLIIGFLTAHEFGHYFASRLHNVKATLPFYIPNPIFGMLNFGTFGAVIKTREPIRSKTALFDIGVSGPIAGFIVCTIYLIIGLTTLPGIEYIYDIHPEYLLLYDGKIPEISLFFGDTIFYWMMSTVFANPDGFLPPMNEIYHYPFLNVGWFGIFVTSLNMLPLGQLDGGHVSYAMFGGKKQLRIAKIVWKAMFVLGISGVLNEFHILLSLDLTSSWYLALQNIFLPPFTWMKTEAPLLMSGWTGWIVWCMITKYFIKLKHPPIWDPEKIDDKRRIIGWIAFLILVLSFSYNGIYII